MDGALTLLTYLNLALLVLAALWIVQATLLRAAMGLALVSVFLTVLMFQMDAPLAAVFELSVCAGLITVVFVSAISLTRRLAPAEAAEVRRQRMKRFLPAIALAGLAGGLLWSAIDLSMPRLPPSGLRGLRDLLWNERQLDLLGQLVMLFVGVFGVVILFKEQKQEDGQKEPSP